MLNDYQKLASAVIVQASRDFIRSQGQDTQAYNFLTGKEEMSSFWFDAAGIDFFQGSPLQLFSSMRKSERALKL